MVAQDGVRIEAKTRNYITTSAFPNSGVTTARFQRKLMKVPIPHYVMCCRKPPSPHRMDIVDPHNKI
jgi:hypothetical protein